MSERLTTTYADAELEALLDTFELQQLEHAEEAAKLHIDLGTEVE